MMCEDTKEYNGHTYSGLLLEACVNGYEQGRADERARLLSLADCDNAECWNCGMADGDMNCILKEKNNEHRD